MIYYHLTERVMRFSRHFPAFLSLIYGNLSTSVQNPNSEYPYIFCKFNLRLWFGKIHFLPQTPYTFLMKSGISHIWPESPDLKNYLNMLKVKCIFFVWNLIFHCFLIVFSHKIKFIYIQPHFLFAELYLKPFCQLLL